MIYLPVVQVSVTDRSPHEVAGEVLVVVFRRTGAGAPRLRNAKWLSEHAPRWLKKEGVGSCWFDTRHAKASRAFAVELPEAPQVGARGGFNGCVSSQEAEASWRETVRAVGGLIERGCSEQQVRHAVLAEWPRDVDPALLVEGALLRGRGSDEWRESEAAPTTLRRLVLCCEREEKSALKVALRRQQQRCRATDLARDLADFPPDKAPSEIAAFVRERAEGSGLKIRTLSLKKATQMGMGLFAAVNRGAVQPGLILELEYCPDKTADLPTLALVGKGVTFDAGGINLKRGHSLHQQNYDKGGAAAVIGAMLGIAALGLRLRVIALCPLTENAVGAGAYRPGEVLTAYNGTTVYVEDTDAEGRLIMADSLAWLCERGPDYVVDIATLTGAAQAALGEPFAALYSNHDGLRELLHRASARSGDGLWAMPIHESYDRDLGHPRAELKNVGVAGGSASAAAAFLRHFVDYPWAHLDIAGKAYTEYARDYYGPGGTGFGCRLLIDLADAISQPSTS